MREIKFRAWDGKDMLSINHWTISMIYEHLPERHIIMQYTGLKDKNTTEIDWWEDDLLQSLGKDKRIGQIKYDERYAEWRLYVDGISWCSLGAAFSDGWVKVGNVHEHPNLLENSEPPANGNGD